MSIGERMAKLFPRQNFVCGGHGARWAKHSHHFTVPQGITIYFYCHDKESLDDEVGQQVDSILAGGSPPRPKSKYTTGERCWNYRLFYSRAGGWLNLAMSSAANDHYITTTDKQTGLLLSDICDTIRRTVPQADIHWSACRAIEDKNKVYPDDPNPEWSKALQKLASKAGKTKI